MEGRFVIITNPGSGKTLTLCEVEVYGAKDGTNGQEKICNLNLVCQVAKFCFFKCKLEIGYVLSILKDLQPFKLMPVFIFLLHCH